MSSFNDSRGYQGNTTGKPGDIGRLIRENASDAQVLAELRSKHPNDVDVVNRLFSEFEEKMSRIRRKAQKFATLILTKYSHLGPKRILEKAKKYKKKYDFSDDEFNAFVNIALSDKAFSTMSSQIPNTAISRTLGHTAEIPVKMQVKSQELDVLQEILKMHNDSTNLHAQVIIQSLTYAGSEECKVLVSKDAKDMYDPRKDNMYTNVHPVLFALFAPKIKDLEERMLLGSISSIVSTRYNGTQFRSQPDWLLYHDLIQDPNEITCAGSKDTPLIDLRNRVKVQVELWRSVRDLRQGRFYAEANAGFTSSLKACKNNFYDSPDFAYIEDEGSVLRKLLSVFAYRPTLVSIQTRQTFLGMGGFSTNVPISNLAMQQVSTVPIINIRLPSGGNATGTAVNIASSLSSPDFYVENKVIVPKVKEVVYTRGVIFFYINRRSFGFDQSKLITAMQPAQFMTNILPFSISGYESINENAVDIAPVNIGNDLYALKSAVLVKLQKIPAYGDKGTPFNFITGSTAVVLCSSDAAGLSGRDGGYGAQAAAVVPGAGHYSLAPATFANIGSDTIKYDPLNEDSSRGGFVEPLTYANDASLVNSIKTSATILVYTKYANEIASNYPTKYATDAAREGELATIKYRQQNAANPLDNLLSRLSAPTVAPVAAGAGAAVDLTGSLREAAAATRGPTGR
jgi:hypothetical protein